MARLQIGIDGRELAGRRTGVGRFLVELLREWTSAPGAADVALTVYVADGHSGAIPSGSGGAACRLVALPGPASTIWEQWSLPRALRRSPPDVFYAPGYSAPLLSPCPTVTVIHDVSFVVHPEWFGWREGLRRRWLASLAARRSRLVFAISAFSADELRRTLGVPGGRLAIASPGVDHGGRFPERRAWAGPGQPPHVLYVGSLFNRRHLPALLRAFAAVRVVHPDARLTIVGENRTHPREDLDALVSALALGSSVALRSYVPEDELEQAYGQATVSVFVSEYEGFGLPPLEALARGVPVIVADTAVSREVLGACARYVAPGDVEGLRDAIIAAAGGGHPADDAAIDERVARYTWRRTAEVTLEGLRRVGGTP
jgi:glycosyltransferase involved in cell wall biosynthesis